MLILIVITVVSIVMYKRRGKERRKMVPSDFSSDKDMLDVMKKSGYVNPTYKYYTQTWHSIVCIYVTVVSLC